MNVPVTVAAKVLGCGVQAVRIGLQRKIMDFGWALQPHDGGRFMYIIPLDYFCKQTGVDKDVVKQAIEESGEPSSPVEECA